MDCADTIIKGLVQQFIVGVLGTKLINYLFFLQNNRFNRAVKQFADFVEQALIASPSKDNQSLLS